jgi:pimeloyl-ACP methyl ester carboxylesterase
MKTPTRVALLVTALVLAATIALTQAAYRRDIRRAFERVATGGRVVQTPCGPIEYAAAGVGEPVLVVHGAGGGFDQGIDFARALAGRGWRVIAMSRFGYLRTPLPAEASAAAQADAHACLLDALDIRRAAIIGASAGAPSSLQFAVRHPERCTALVLLVPAAYVPRPGGAASLTTPAWTRLLASTALRSDFLLWAAIRLAPSTVIGSLLATPPEVVQRASAGEQARVAEILDHILPVSARRLGLMNDAAITSTLSRAPLEHIAAPTLTISLADDGFGTYDGARYTAEHIPGARFIGYARGGHVWVGHQEEVAAAIATFLGAATGRW